MVEEEDGQEEGYDAGDDGRQEKDGERDVMRRWMVVRDVTIEELDADGTAQDGVEQRCLITLKIKDAKLSCTWSTIGDIHARSDV